MAAQIKDLQARLKSTKRELREFKSCHADKFEQARQQKKEAQADLKEARQTLRKAEVIVKRANAEAAAYRKETLTKDAEMARVREEVGQQEKKLFEERLALQQGEPFLRMHEELQKERSLRSAVESKLMHYRGELHNTRTKLDMLQTDYARKIRDLDEAKAAAARKIRELENARRATARTKLQYQSRMTFEHTNDWEQNSKYWQQDSQRLRDYLKALNVKTEDDKVLGELPVNEAFRLYMIERRTLDECFIIVPGWREGAVEILKKSLKPPSEEKPNEKEDG